MHETWRRHDWHDPCSTAEITGLYGRLIKIMSKKRYMVGHVPDLARSDVASP